LLISNNYGKHCCSLALIISEGTSSDYLQNKNPCSLAIGINAGNGIISYKEGGGGGVPKAPPPKKKWKERKEK